MSSVPETPARPVLLFTTVFVERLDGTRASVRVPQGSSEESVTACVTEYVNRVYGWETDDLWLEKSPTLGEYIAVYYTAALKFIHVCSIDTTMTESDKETVWDELRDFIKQHAIQVLDVSEICAHFNLTAIGDYAFTGCTSLIAVTLPTGVTRIGAHAFSGCTSLRTLTIPESVTAIAQYAFNFCTSLRTLTIPESVTVVDERAFDNCSSLATVTITTLPESVVSVGRTAHENCSLLVPVAFPY
jgi:hypothetical protein